MFTRARSRVRCQSDGFLVLTSCFEFKPFFFFFLVVRPPARASGRKESSRPNKDRLQKNKEKIKKELTMSSESLSTMM